MPKAAQKSQIHMFKNKNDIKMKKLLLIYLKSNII